jgi:hypothetical protein
MTFRSSRFILPVAAIAASGALFAAESTTPDVDPCVVYPYYGQTSTPVPNASPALASDVDPCVVYPYFGQTSTPVPGATKTAAGSGDQAANQVVVSEWGVTETPEDLQRILAALRHGQYLGL